MARISVASIDEKSDELTGVITEPSPLKKYVNVVNRGVSEAMDAEKTPFKQATNTVGTNQSMNPTIEISVSQVSSDRD